MSALPSTDGFWWFTWGTQPPDYDETSVIWLPALVRDNQFLPLGVIRQVHDPVTGKLDACQLGSHHYVQNWRLVSHTEPSQWGAAIAAVGKRATPAYRRSKQISNKREAR